MAASTALSVRVYSSIKDIRLAGLSTDDLVSSHFEQPDKASELSAVMAQYLSILRESGLIDYAEALELAMNRIRDSFVASDGVLFIIPEDMEFTAKEGTFINSFPPEKLVIVPVDKPLIQVNEFSGSLLNADLLRWLPDPAAAPPPNQADDTVSIFSAVGEVNEIREVFRNIVSKGIPLDEVEILHTDKSTYVPLIYEFTSRIIPDLKENSESIVTFAEGIPATYSRPGKALRGWVSWVRQGFMQSTLIRMLEDRVISVSDSSSGVAGCEALAAELRPLGIGFGKDRYLIKVDELVSSLEMRLVTGFPIVEDDDSGKSRKHYVDRLQAASELRRLLEALLEVTPEPSDAAAKILDSATRFLQSFVRPIDEVDGYAFRALLDEINDMARYVNEDPNDLSLDVWERLAQLPADVRIMGSGPRPGRVHVANIN
jgi:hypothetical protein